MEWVIKQDQYTVIEYTQREAAAITHTLRSDDSELVTVVVMLRSYSRTARPGQQGESP